MSSRFIPRDQLSAVLPWQLAALDPHCTKRKSGLMDTATETELAGAAVNRARDEGFRHGLEVGYTQGHAACEAKTLRHNQHLTTISAALESAVAALDETVANDLVQLALELARQVVRAHIDTHPETLVPVVREALNSVIAIAKHPRLVMHPDDAQMITREMAVELGVLNCSITPDDHVARGGVRIEDANFELDATLPTRWSRTLATLGLKDDWLA